MTLTRRSFIKTSTALATGLVAPTYLKAGTLSASDRVNVALIGCRSMGWSDLMSFLSSGEVHCLALCDIDQSVLDSKAKSWLPGRRQEFQLYSDYRQVLDRKDIDSGDYRHPDHWHCLQFVGACKAGKDVYVGSDCQLHASVT